ncbi:non-specific lipid transfer protein GPI-anchored 25 [Impatiens glandulifera]|uniref:non-specific lipid transfer protein GPI-anchored 25 n=1 Tax=Impatiens glandulifera TaxID=253017 RepID=UPI001FB08F57|nr:non-specific lipid transfer protein GPI-anchored 25 [Impatiens glandulifera]
MSIGIQVLIQTIAVELILMLLLALASTPRSPPPPDPAAAVGCSNEVVSFSACLPYISSSPNNRSSKPSMQCCRMFSYAFLRQEATCLCYLVRRPLIYSFPLNTTRLYYLSTLCRRSKIGFVANHSLESLCSDTGIHSFEPPPAPPPPPPPLISSPVGSTNGSSSSSDSITVALKSLAMEIFLITSSLLAAIFTSL